MYLSNEFNNATKITDVWPCIKVIKIEFAWWRNSCVRGCTQVTFKNNLTLRTSLLSFRKANRCYVHEYTGGLRKHSIKFVIFIVILGFYIYLNFYIKKKLLIFCLKWWWTNYDVIEFRFSVFTVPCPLYPVLFDTTRRQRSHRPYRRWIGLSQIEKDLCPCNHVSCRYARLCYSNCRI